jgi:tRNA G10  N-methylase Trm11
MLNNMNPTSVPHARKRTFKTDRSLCLLVARIAVQGIAPQQGRTLDPFCETAMLEKSSAK